MQVPHLENGKTSHPFWRTTAMLVNMKNEMQAMTSVCAFPSIGRSNRETYSTKWVCQTASPICTTSADEDAIVRPIHHCLKSNFARSCSFRNLPAHQMSNILAINWQHFRYDVAVTCESARTTLKWLTPIRYENNQYATAWWRLHNRNCQPCRSFSEGMSAAMVAMPTTFITSIR